MLKVYTLFMSDNCTDCDHPETLDLTGCYRRSLCCFAPIIHSSPMDAKSLRRCLQVVCAGCGQVVKDWEVVTGDGIRIWPLPEGFEVPENVKLCHLHAETGKPHVIRLDSRILRRFL